MSKSRTGVCDSIVTIRAPDCEQALQLLLGRQEHALAHDVGLIVEEPVNRLEAQVGHPDEVRVRKREGDAQPVGVRLLHVADFAGQESRARSRWDFDCHGTETSQTDAAHRHDAAGNRRSAEADRVS